MLEFSWVICGALYACGCMLFWCFIELMQDSGVINKNRMPPSGKWLPIMLWPILSMYIFWALSDE